MNNIEFTLSLEEANVVLEALGQMPFMRVHELIAKIQKQAEAQLQEGQKNHDAKHLNPTKE